MQKYTAICDGKEENVELEQWAWCAVYEDDTELRQFDAEGRYHFVKEIDLSKIKTLIMYRTDDEAQRFDLMVKPGTQLFVIYRNLIIRAATPEQVTVRTPIFGWKIQGKDNCAYHYILPTGKLIISAGHDTQNVSAIIEKMIE